MAPNPVPGPRPADPVLATVADAVEARGFAAEIWDVGWRLAYLSSDYARISNAGRDLDWSELVGAHTLSPEMAAARDGWPSTATAASSHALLGEFAKYVCETTPGGIDAVRALADPRYLDLVETAPPTPPPAVWSGRVDVTFGTETIGNDVLCVSLHGRCGSLAGFLVLVKPELSATVLGMLALGDVRVFEQMRGLVSPARRPAAVLFADLENSTPLAKQLSTEAYFALMRRIMVRSDRAIVDAGGVVGKHVGDGITAFFLADQAGSESAAARACIESMRRIREATTHAAKRSDLDPTQVTMRFGLHWGSTLYVGRVVTSGRMEVTALGEDVNDAARIEACASGARALASKALMERLDVDASQELRLDLNRLTYTPLSTLASATDKARRDAPALTVCEL